MVGTSEPVYKLDVCGGLWKSGVLWKDADASSKASVGTSDDRISELAVSNGGGLGSIPTEVGSGRSESVSGSELGLFGLVARSHELVLQRGKFPAWLRGS